MDPCPMKNHLQPSDLNMPQGAPTNLPKLPRESAPPWKRSDWIALSGVLFTFLIFATLTWAHWGNLRIDCGREMYVPQQLSRGRLLYRDLWYPYGPLAPYWNALLFRLFGVNLVVLYASGLSVTLTFTCFLYAITRRVTSSLVAFVTILCFQTQAFHPGLFNFVLPYAYGSTMGSLFTLIFLYFLIRHIRNESGWNLPLAGLWAGLTLLTKFEFGLACYFIFAFYQLLDLRTKKNVQSLILNLRAFLPGILIPVGGYGFFVWKLSLPFFIRDSFSREFYVQWSRRQGLRFAPAEVLILISVLIFSLVIWFLLALLTRRIFKFRRNPAIWLALLLPLVWALHLRWGAYFPLAMHFISLYFLAPGGIFWLAVAFLVRAVVRWQRRPYRTAELTKAVLACYALSIGVRIMSKVELANYSIYYNTGLYLIFVMVISEIALRVGIDLKKTRRQALVGFLVMVEGLGLLSVNYPWRTMPQSLLRTDRGSIFAKSSEAELFPSIIRFIREKSREGKTVLVVPEETSLYFFAGVEAPTRWYMIHPYILSPEWKEREYIHGLETRGIDYILLSNRTNVEYGFAFFGINYNRLVYQWITKNFQVVGQFGHFSRETPSEFGMLLYQRKDKVEDTFSPP